MRRHYSFKVLHALPTYSRMSSDMVASLLARKAKVHKARPTQSEMSNKKRLSLVVLKMFAPRPAPWRLSYLPAAACSRGHVLSQRGEIVINLLRLLASYLSAVAGRRRCKLSVHLDCTALVVRERGASRVRGSQAPCEVARRRLIVLLFFFCLRFVLVQLC